MKTEGEGGIFSRGQEGEKEFSPEQAVVEGSLRTGDPLLDEKGRGQPSESR